MAAREGEREGWKDGEIRKASHLKLYTVTDMLLLHIVGGELQLTPLMDKGYWQLG